MKAGTALDRIVFEKRYHSSRRLLPFPSFYSDSVLTDLIICTEKVHGVR